MQELIRNFSIIAHIDHGKSTLADRILQFTGAIDERRFRSQLLDDMDLERERGITIKASAVRIDYKAKDGKSYVLNLIDTPGHVDFTYEVSKSIAACEGALLLVDASQGVEAQTVANYYLAREHNLKVVPIINKIDIAGADIEGTKQQIVDILRLKAEEVILASAKEGIATEEILERIVSDIPYPEGKTDHTLQALVFDSQFNTYKGVIVYFRIMNGSLKKGDRVKFMNTNQEHAIEELGVLRPDEEKMDSLSVGEVGFLTCGIRDPAEVMIGDTLTLSKNPAEHALPGYKPVKPLVFCGIYPVNPGDFSALRVAMEKLKLSDASFVYEPENSISCGHGFRCGFLGLLHMEIVQERLEREYDLNLILASPSVVYRVTTKDGKVGEIESPQDLPDTQLIAQTEEPYISVFIMLPTKNIEAVMELAKSRRGMFVESDYLSVDRVKVVFDMPLAEVIVDFYDKIKSVTRGYGSLDYEFKGYLPTKVVRLDVMINEKRFDALSTLVHKDKAQGKGKALVVKLKELVPRQLYEVRVQAAVGSHIIASERIRPLGKHVTGKCYGGDITRKRKLWEKQKEGKKRLKKFGNVNIPQEAFLAALKI